MTQDGFSREQTGWLRGRTLIAVGLVVVAVIVIVLAIVLSGDDDQTREAEVPVVLVTQEETTAVVTQAEGSAAVTAEAEITTATDEPMTSVEAEPTPDQESARMGGWLDQIVFVEEVDADVAVARLVAGDLDLYAGGIGNPSTVQAIRDAGTLQTRTVYGLFDEIFFNNGPCADENVLNPFTKAKIREAMNWAVDRDLIAEEIYGGLAVPKFTPLTEAGADRARFAPEIRAVEAQYAYDFERANETIAAEMEGMGATREGGLWTFNGQPVKLIFLIRTEDTRLQIGNYVANQLEELGFVVERVEGIGGGLGPIWIGSDPAECQWHLYTGAWVQSDVERSSVEKFEFFYTPRGIPWASYQLFKPTPEFDRLAQRLYSGDFSSLEERAELVRQALPLALEMSPRIWTTSRVSQITFRDEVSVATDLATGVLGYGTSLWPRTLRRDGQVGGSMTIGLWDAFNRPWNPIGGSTWPPDSMVRLGLSDSGLYTDPNTGLYIPVRAERGELVIREGDQVNRSLVWVTVTAAPQIVVPDDAWVDWDATDQVFLTAGQVYTEPQTAAYKSTIYYPDDMFETVTWHDGSPLSVADFVIGIIQTFDLVKEDSPHYDESLIPYAQQFQAGFRGLRIVSTDPLVIEHWGDDVKLDAENNIHDWWPGIGVWATYPAGDAPWHNFGLLLRGQADLAFALTPDKAAALGLEQANLLAGPSLEVLANELTAARDEGWIPYEPTLGQYISGDEAAARYASLAEFANDYGHYYLGTGPYFLSDLFLVEGQAVLSHYDAYPDPAGRFAGFGAPPLPVVDIDGPGRVTIGGQAAFDILIDNEASGEPYLMDDIVAVTYLLFDASGALVEQGQAEAVTDGLWQAVLGPETTGMLDEGANRLEVVVESRLVALPGQGGVEFVTSP